MINLENITNIEEISLEEYNKSVINSIKDKYPNLRQISKGITFGLQYGAIPMTIVNNAGFPLNTATAIYDSYHKLYVTSTQYKADRIKEATHAGYVTLAFGLRLRTPILKQSILGTKVTPFEAEAEARTAGNALFQSWGLLNTRASIEFMNKVRSTSFATKIKPVMHIHDAQYYLIDDDIDVLHFLNKHLVIAVNWNSDPLIYHPGVPLGGSVSVFYPSWKDEITISNGSSKEEILNQIYKETHD